MSGRALALLTQGGRLMTVGVNTPIGLEASATCSSASVHVQPSFPLSPDAYCPKLPVLCLSDCELLEGRDFTLFLLCLLKVVLPGFAPGSRGPVYTIV